MLSEAQRALIDGMEGRTESTNSAEGKYQLSERAEDDVHYAVTHPSKGGYIRLRDITPQVLVDIGIKNLPMHMKASHIRENVLTNEEAARLGVPTNEKTEFHGLGEEVFLSAVDGLDTPVEVYRWKKNGYNRYGENDFIVITPAVDGNGNNVIVPFVINSSAKENSVWVASNEIKSVYGKENLRDYINRNVKRGALERKKIRPGAASGVQFPGDGNNAVADNAHASLISNSMVPQSDTAVNNYSMQEAENDAQGDFSLMEDDQYKADIAAAEEEITASKMEAAIEEEQAAEAAEIANEISSFGESGEKYNNHVKKH